MNDVRNYRKRLSMGASVVGALAYQMAASVLAQFAAGELQDRPLPTINPMMGYKLPYAWQLGPSKHGCCKRGGRSKRRRQLNYWRH